MRDGRVYDQDIRLYKDIEDNLAQLKATETLSLSMPFYDEAAKTELIIIYLPNPDSGSKPAGVAAYYKVSEIYTIGEFYVSDTARTIFEKDGNSVFLKDKGITVASRWRAMNFRKRILTELRILCRKKVL